MACTLLNEEPAHEAASMILPAPSPVPVDGPTSRTATVWLAPLASGVLLYLSYFPVAFGWLAWFALVPWLCLVRMPGRPRRLYLATWLGAVAFYLPALEWARVADPRMYVTWIALSLYCAGYVTLVLAIVRRLERRTALPLVLTFPTVWVAIEFVRWGMFGSFLGLVTGSHQHDLPGGFGWYFLGHSQHDFPEILQLADVGGAYGISFLVAAVNVLLFEILFIRNGCRRLVLGDEAVPRMGRTGLLIQGLGVSACLLGALGYGTWRLGQESTHAGPRIALLQGNVDQRIRTRASGPEGEERDEARKKLASHYVSLADFAVKRKAELVVWPETSYPGYWEELAPGRPNLNSRTLAKDMSDEWHTPMLLGMNASVGGEQRPRGYNSAILLGADGTWLGRYDKVHRVPFGEYVPLRAWLPVLGRLAPYDFDYSVEPGEQFTRFTLPGKTGSHTFGVMICYEDTDPAMARPYVRTGSRPVDFLLNLSNDGWFDGSSEHDQHLAQCRFRAVETRRAIGRAVNMGISAVIDSNGRVLAPRQIDEVKKTPIWEVNWPGEELRLGDWHRYKKVSGVLLATMPIDTRTSLYAAWGDWLGTSCLGCLVVLTGMTMRRKPGGDRCSHLTIP